MTEFFFPFSFRDFILNTWTKDLPAKKNESDKKYCWEIFENPPMDGILVSRPAIDKKVSFFENENWKIKDILRVNSLNRNLKVFGDCGAFMYIGDEKPPYDPIEQVEFYHKHEFDWGAAVDHIIVPAFEEQKEFRLNITIENAKVMYKKWKGSYDNFELVGVIQGWDIKSMISCFRELIEVGYKRIAIGGVARKSKEKPLEELIRKIDNIRKKEHENVKIHVFGVGKAESLEVYKKYHIESFDYSGIYRNSWLRDQGYYLFNRFCKKKDILTHGLDKFFTIRISGKSIIYEKYVEDLVNYDFGKIGYLELLKNLEEYSYIIFQDFFEKYKNQGSTNKQKEDSGNNNDNLNRINKDPSRKKKVQKNLIDGIDEFSIFLKKNPKIRRNANKLPEKEYSKFKSLFEFQTVHNKEVLDQKPWKQCDCVLCKKFGIDNIIFSGGERNIRRGFHNLYNYYDYISMFYGK